MQASRCGDTGRQKSQHWARLLQPKGARGHGKPRTFSLETTVRRTHPGDAAEAASAKNRGIKWMDSTTRIERPPT